MPLNGSSSDFMWNAKQHLVLDFAGWQQRRINSAGNSHDFNGKVKPVHYKENVKVSFQWRAFLHGLLLVFVILILYGLLRRFFSGQRRRRSLRIVLRCCFGWWKFIQHRMGVATETWSSDVTIHLPAETSLVRRKSSVHSKTNVNQPRSKSFSEHTQGKIQAV